MVLGSAVLCGGISYDGIDEGMIYNPLLFGISILERSQILALLSFDQRRMYFMVMAGSKHDGSILLVVITDG